MNSIGACKREDEIGVPRKDPNPNYINKSIVLAGYSVRGLNLSAKAACLKTLAVDCFADMDLRRIADKFIHVNLNEKRDEHGKLEHPGAHYLYKTIKSNAELISKYDYLILGSSFENYPSYIKEIQSFDNYKGNLSNSVQKVRKTGLLFPFLIKNKIRFPKSIVFSIGGLSKRIKYSIFSNSNATDHIESEPLTNILGFKAFFDEVVKIQLDLPCVLKPEKSGGGFGIYTIRNFEDFKTSFNNLQEIKDGNYLLQEYVLGKHMSCSFISNGENAKIVCISEQIIGELRFGCHSSFAYCGNVISKKISDPTNEENRVLSDKLRNIIQSITKFSGILGSNGLDFILNYPDGKNSEPQITFLELNARFQGTIGLIEAATGINIVEMHLSSIIDHKLPDPVLFPDDNTYIRAIYYSPIDFHVLVDLQGFNYRDVPLIGNKVFTGQPLCSSILIGKDKIEAFEKALDDRDLLSRVLGIKSRIPPDSEFLKRI